MKITKALLGSAAASLLLASGAASAASAKPIENEPVVPPSGAQLEHRALSPDEAALLACNTSVSQPGGAKTTIFVTYNNCGISTVNLTPIAFASNFDGSFTYVGACWRVPGGTAFTWEVRPNVFPPTDTNRWGLTNCL